MIARMPDFKIYALEPNGERLAQFVEASAVAVDVAIHHCGYRHQDQARHHALHCVRALMADVSALHDYLLRLTE